MNGRDLTQSPAQSNYSVSIIIIVLDLLEPFLLQHISPTCLVSPQTLVCPSHRGTRGWKSGGSSLAELRQCLIY